MSDTLEQILTDIRGEAAVYRHRGDAWADRLDEICERVYAATEDYLRWLSESEAQLRSGKSVTWLRSHFAEWAREGHAIRDGKVRKYRQLIIPRRANTSAAYLEGKRVGRAS